MAKTRYLLIKLKDRSAYCLRIFNEFPPTFSVVKYLSSLLSNEIQIWCTYCHLTDNFITGLHYEKFTMVQKTPSMLQAKAWWCILKCNFNMVETQKFASKQQPCRVQITIMWKLNSWQQHVDCGGSTRDPKDTKTQVCTLESIIERCRGPWNIWQIQ